MIYFSQLTDITGGKNLQLFKDSPIDSIVIDSRKAFSQENTLFFAIKGERNDGHFYMSQLYQQGIRQFIVEQQPVDLHAYSEANILLVFSAVDALQKIAAFHRLQFSGPVIGITGSNGKTIIKEWLYQILSKDQVVVKNPGSYNSQVGVPLSVWQLQPHHQLAIFEAGISQPGEMVNLERVIQPTIGIFTNIGTAHNEGFKDQNEKISEKLRLFKNAEVLIFRADHAHIRNAVSQTKLKTFTWGKSDTADVKISIDGMTCFIFLGGQEQVLKLPFTDQASIENCMHCVALMAYLQFPFKKIQRSVTNLRSVPMRMQMKEGINQSYIVDDTYNNDLGGLELSLQFLTHQHQKKKKRLILSDILESGLRNDILSKEIQSLLEKYPVDQFVGIGLALKSSKELFNSASIFYTNVEDFLSQFDFSSISEETILVKGARVFEFEKIVQKLQRKVHGTVMEIDLGALVHNLNFFKSRLRPQTKIMVMVKAFAYGSGSPEVANILQYHKVDYLGVAYVDEGVELRKNNISLPIMVMNPSEDSFQTLLDYNLEPEIYSFKMFDFLIRFLNGRPCCIHLKLDTGMHRLGFVEHEAQQLIHILQQYPSIKIASVFSHLAGADASDHDSFSKQQAERFEKLANDITHAIGYKPLYHLLNSPGILRHPHLQFDMVRLGIGLYGIDPTHEKFNSLRPVATLRTLISQIKHILKGETIGYGRKGIAEHDMKLATLAIGYADGFSRKLSTGVGEVLIDGKRAKVMGNVCMDMTMVDITGIDTHEGDEAIVFGPNLSIQEMADKLDTIPYEILTMISERVKRVFVSDGI